MIDKINILYLYKLYVDEELKFINMHQDRVKFFTGLLSGLVAGTVAGLLKSIEWYHFALMTLGPILIIIISWIAEKSISRLYQRFLETVTVRAKMEQVMGLTHRPEELDNIPDAYWSQEPFVATRHLKSRKRKFNNSQEWVEAHLKQGYNRWTYILFRGSQVLGLVLLLAIMFLAWKSC